MKNNSRASKGLVLVLALVMLVSVAVGGTVAWLLDKTESITNTFNPTDIDVAIGETEEDYTMIPGATIHKDPKITVTSTAVDCWLFVRVTKSANFDDYMSFGMADGWVIVPGTTGVYYKEVTKSASAQEFQVLEDDLVMVKPGVTKTMMDEAKTAQPTLTFTAYVVQKDAAVEPKDAWARALVDANY